LDFAQEKGIEFKLQYEDKEDQRKNYYQKDNKNFQGKNYYNNNYKNNQNNFQGKNFHKNNFKYNNNKKFGYNNFNQKPKNNKFDQANMMMNSINPQGNYINNNNFNMNFDPFFKGEKTCEEILAYIFSNDFLNRELYLRKRISEDGLIEINNLMMFNKIKHRNFTMEQVKDGLANLGEENFELKEIDGNLFIRIVQWEKNGTFAYRKYRSAKEKFQKPKISKSK